MAGREYSIVKHTFWTGETGRKLREAGPDAVIVALYLTTCQSASMIGLYYLPLPLLCHELGMTAKGAIKALRRVGETGFAQWDAPSEHVFVPEMAAHQIGESMKETDNRVKSVNKLWFEMRKSPFYLDFHARYGQAFHLAEPHQREAPPKPLRSQEQEQEQEQKQKKGGAAASVTIPEKLRTERFQGAWERWLAYRKEEGYTVKAMALTAQLKKLDGFGEEAAVQAIESSIENTWKGLFPPKSNGNGKPETPTRQLNFGDDDD